MRALLVHSPLVGPSTMSKLGSALDRLGWHTVTPDLRDNIGSPESLWQAAVDAADAAAAADVVIGHSGAGAFLPIISERVSATSLVFVDAVLPGQDTAFHPSPEFRALIAQLPDDDGLLPPWHTWWPADTLSRLVPDDADRAAIIGEIPRLTRAFYDPPVPVPANWWRRPAAYLQLSPAYDAERQRAAGWGWPVRDTKGQHLDVVVTPDVIAELVAELA